MNICTGLGSHLLGQQIDDIELFKSRKCRIITDGAIMGRIIGTVIYLVRSSQVAPSSSALS